MGIKQDDWERSFQKAFNYYTKYGNLNVSSSFVTEEGFKLGIWIQNQRSSFKKGILSKDRISKLNSIDFDFSNKRHRLNWEKAYKRAKEYYEKNGDLDIPTNYLLEDGFNLGGWICSQRTAYKKNELSEEKINRLKDIKMRFDNKINDWYGSYAIAKKYHEEHGNLNVGARFKTEEGFSLGWWLSC